MSGREIFLLVYAVVGWLLAWLFAGALERERKRRNG